MALLGGGAGHSGIAAVFLACMVALGLTVGVRFEDGRYHRSLVRCFLLQLIGDVKPYDCSLCLTLH